MVKTFVILYILQAAKLVHIDMLMKMKQHSATFLTINLLVLWNKQIQTVHLYFLHPPLNHFITSLSFTGCIRTATVFCAPLVFILASPCPLHSFPDTAHSVHSTSPIAVLLSTPLFTWDHRLKPGRITVTWCPCMWCFAGTPLHSGNALGLFPTLVFRCGELGITTESSYHPKAFLTDSNHCLALGSHRQWGYAVISNRLEQWVSSCELPKLFMAEQRSLSSTMGNYHAHSPPSPSFNLWFVCRWVRLCTD